MLLSENVHFIKGIDPAADPFAGTVYSDIISMSEFEKLVFVLYKGVGATGTATLTVQACDDVSASNTTAIVFKYKASTTGDTWGATTAALAAGFVTTLGSSQMYIVSVDAADVAATGYEFVRLASVEGTDSPVLGCILAIGYGERYAQEVPNTAIV